MGFGNRPNYRTHRIDIDVTSSSRPNEPCDGQLDAVDFHYPRLLGFPALSDSLFSQIGGDLTEIMASGAAKSFSQTAKCNLLDRIKIFGPSPAPNYDYISVSDFVLSSFFLALILLACFSTLLPAACCM